MEVSMIPKVSRKTHSILCFTSVRTHMTKKIIFYIKNGLKLQFHMSNGLYVCSLIFISDIFVYKNKLKRKRMKMFYSHCLSLPLCAILCVLSFLPRSPDSFSLSRSDYWSPFCIVILASYEAFIIPNFSFLCLTLHRQ